MSILKEIWQTAKKDAAKKNKARFGVYIADAFPYELITLDLLLGAPLVAP